MLPAPTVLLCQCDVLCSGANPEITRITHTNTRTLLTGRIFTVNYRRIRGCCFVNIFFTTTPQITTFAAALFELTARLVSLLRLTFCAVNQHHQHQQQQRHIR